MVDNAPVETAIRTLINVLPVEFRFYTDTRAWKYRDVQVVCEHDPCNGGLRWIGPQKNVVIWYELSNGYAVGFNENPSRGWTFPVEKLKAM